MVPKILLLLPVLVCCNISINIRTFDNTTDASIKWNGYFNNTISHKEILSFGFTEKLVKKAIQSFTPNKVEPEIVYFEGPVPWNKKWKGFQRILSPFYSETLHVKTENLILSVEEFNSTYTSHVDFPEATVTYSFKAAWLTRDAFDVKGDIEYSIVRDSSSKFEFRSPWESDAKKVYQGTVYTDCDENDIEVILIFGQTAISTLYITKVTQVVLIEYTAYVEGLIFGYSPTVYTYYTLDELNYTLAEGNLPESIRTGQIITLEYYIKGKLIVTDKATNETLLEAKAVIH